jgi:transposase
VSDHSEAFVALDTSKLRNAVAIADGGRGDEVRFLGEFDNTPAATAKLVRKLASKYERLTFCYEAGPTGYGLYRQVKSLGHECIVAAPSLVPQKAGDRVKTNRRDAMNLAKLLRSGDLTAVWVPDPHHESVRELTRARETAMNDLRAKRQQISAFLLRRGVHYAPDKKTWGKMHINWLMSQKFAFSEERIVFEELMEAMRQAQGRLERLAAAIHAAVPDWSLCKLATALMAMRGLDMISAATIAAEIGDMSRFPTARGLMDFVGIVPSEDSTGDKIKRGRITKAGNRRVRRILVECSWSYQHPPRLSKDKQAKVEAAPPAVREIAWKAQSRLNRRYRALLKRGKLKTVAITAVARELAGFIWAVSRAVSTAQPATRRVAAAAR